MASKWKTAFKAIHGKTPSKEDYAFAPESVKTELVGGCVQENIQLEEKKSARKSRIRLKRPADDQFSPMRPLPKRQHLDVETTIHSRTTRNLFSVEKNTMIPIRTSPRKSPARFSICTFETSNQSINIVKSASPRKLVGLSFLPSTSNSTDNHLPFHVSPKKSLTFVHEFSSPCKKFLEEQQPPIVQGTPVRSPQKPLRKTFHLLNADALLASTPEKQKIVEEEPEAFEAEIIPEKTKKREPLKDVAKVFDPTTGKIITRSYKSKIATTKTIKRPKEKENFVRINLRKKSYTRGKVSAEAKRKLKKKFLYKKRFGGK